MKLVSIFILVTSLGVFGSDAYKKKKTEAPSLKTKLEQRANASSRRVDPALKQKMMKGQQLLVDSKLAEKSLQEGSQIPDVSMLNLASKEVSLKRLTNNKTIVLTMYRGAWCPYCMIELKHYQKMITEFQAAGVEVIALGPDTVVEIKKMKKKHGLSFDVYRDPGLRVAKSFGVKFKLDPDTLSVYNKFGIDLEGSQGNKENSLPLPGTYVIKNGKIVYAYVDPDYRKRAEPSEVLAAAKNAN